MKNQIKKINGFNPGTLLLAVIVSLIICFGITASGQAFYRQSEIGDFSVFNAESRKFSLASNNSELAIYDNLYQLFINKGRTNMLFPVSKSFVEADIIDWSRSVQHYDRMVQSADTKLSNLLYANLKIKILIDEYDAFQQSVSKCLSDYVVPFLDLKSNNFVPSFGKESFYKKRENLVRSRQTLSRNIDISYSAFSNRIEIAQVNRTESVLPVMSSHREDHREKSFTYQSVKPSSQTISAEVERFNGSQIENEYANNRVRKEKKKPVESSNRELPWFFKILISFPEYCYENITEVAIYGTLLMLVVSIFVGGKKG